MNTPMLASAFAHLAPARLSDANRLYTLEGPPLFDALQVERWYAESALSTCGGITIDALSNEADLSLDAMLGQTLTLHTTQADGTRTPHSGLVREARLLGADGSLARYRLMLVPWLWLLGEGRHSRIFQERSVLDIVAEVFADYRDYGAWKITSDARQWLAAVRPRSYTVQYRETDLAFVERLLAEEGLGYTFVDDAEAPSGHTLVIFADSGQLPEDMRSAGSPEGIRFHRAAATEASDAIQALGREGVMGPSSVTQLSWDYKAMAAISAQVPVQGGKGGESYDPVGAYAFADSREAAHYAQLAAEAHETLQQHWVGRGSVRGARVGTRFRVAQSPLQVAEMAMPESFLWTRLTEAGINNLPASIRHAARDHLGEAVFNAPADVESWATADTRAAIMSLWARAETTGYAQHFEAVDAARPWRPVLADEHGTRLNPRSTAPGTQTAIVVGPEGETTPGAAGPLHTDKRGRLKVRFHWMEHGASCWLRCVQRYAGQGHGAQFLPRIGQEVLVSFLDGDIDRPVITGALYNGYGEAGIAPTPGAGEATPEGSAYAQANDQRASAQGNLGGGHSPAWHGQGAGNAAHANAAALSGIKTRGFDGAGHNQLVFDDTDRQGRIQFASSQAASQLNLGHLVHQQDNYRGSFRGIGLELRSDGYGSIRGRRGLLLTTWAGNTHEPAADANAVGALLNQHVQLAQTLSGAARTHQTMPLAGHEGTIVSDQSALSDKAAPLKALRESVTHTVTGDNYADAEPGGAIPHSRDAVTTLAGRAGIVSIAGQSLHHSAGETLNLGSGRHINLGVAEQLRLHANQGIGLVAGAQGAKGVGLNLTAGRGEMDVQAQHDTLKLRSKDGLELVSTDAAIDLAAKKVIRIATEQGAYIHIENGNITFGAPGKLSIKAGNHKMVGGTHLSREMNGWREPKFDERVRVTLRDGKTPAVNHHYEYVRADGAKIRGVTDSDGWATVQNGQGMEELSIRLLGRA